MFNIEMIIRSIQSGLTNNSVKDIMYLEEIAKKYADHENADEILNAISIMSFQALSKEDQNAYVNEQIQIVHEAIEEKEYARGLTMVESLIAKVETYHQDHTYDIADDLEAIVIYSLTKQQVATTLFPYVTIYDLKADLLYELHQYENAIQALDTAIQYSPGNIRLYFKKADLYRSLNDLEKFFISTLNAFPYLNKAEYASKAYYNVGYYLIEKKDYQNAIAAFALCLNYGENENAYNELAYIQNILQKEIDYPTMKDLERMANKYHVPLALNETVLSYMYTFGVNYLKTNKEKGKYLIQTLYDLTKDDTLLGYLK